MSSGKSEAQFGGMFGESVKAKRGRGGNTLVRNNPKRSVGDPSDKQIAVQRKLKRAAAWAQKQVAKPEINALYAAKITPKLKSAFMVALTDFLTSPEILGMDTKKYLGKIGDVLIILAFDDFLVAKVEVTITGADGIRIESGDATADDEKADLWTYTATVANATLAGTKFTVTAIDRVGNETSRDMVI